MSAPRGTIHSLEAPVVAHRDRGAGQYELTVHAPEVAERAGPGQFAHLRCGPRLPMRRPLSVLDADPDTGRMAFLYKVVGEGTAELARREVGETVGVLGPIGVPFSVPETVTRPLLLGGGVGIPPMQFLARRLAEQGYSPTAFLGSEVPFPFAEQEAVLPLKGAEGRAPDRDRAHAALEAWGVANRLASAAGLAGAFPGYVTDLAEAHLQALNTADRAGAALFAVGPEPMLRATAALARRHDLPAWVSLEEHMACAVGGCAGCVVRVTEPAGPAMRRVCVDGPVFPAEGVYPEG